MRPSGPRETLPIQSKASTFENTLVSDISKKDAGYVGQATTLKLTAFCRKK